MAPPSLLPERIHRTPEERFKDVPDFPYTPHYDFWGNLRYAYIDLLGPVYDSRTGIQVSGELSKNAKIVTETILCLHGEPSWSFLYRKMIPGFLNSAAARPSVPEERRYVQRRILVPDFLGFGRSDKPIDEEFYTWDNHRDWLINFVYKHLVLHPKTAQGGRVTLVVQDWGGLLGLILPSIFPATFTHLIVMNTGLGVGVPPTKGWLAFRDFIARSPNLDVGALFKRGTPLNDAEVAAYNAPYHTQESKAGVRRFPQLVPVDPSMRGVPDSRAALQYFQSLTPLTYSSNAFKSHSTSQSQGLDVDKPGVPLQVFVCVGKADPVLGLPVMQALAKSAWGDSVGYWWHVIDEAGHFVQEVSLRSALTRSTSY